MATFSSLASRLPTRQIKRVNATTKKKETQKIISVHTRWIGIDISCRFCWLNPWWGALGFSFLDLILGLTLAYTTKNIRFSVTIQHNITMHRERSDSHSLLRFFLSEEEIRETRNSRSRKRRTRRWSTIGDEKISCLLRPATIPKNGIWEFEGEEGFDLD